MDFPITKKKLLLTSNIYTNIDQKYKNNDL